MFSLKKIFDHGRTQNNDLSGSADFIRIKIPPPIDGEIRQPSIIFARFP